jgi:N-methylhydantoinase B
MSKQKPLLDAIERTFFNNLFVSLAEEMGVTLARTAYSPNIKERKDFSCAYFTPEGKLLAQAAHIPVHLGAMPMSVEAIIRRFPEMKSGDVYVVNDPFCGGTHLPDITVVSPVFFEGNLVGYLATRAHHADVGGISPGSLPISTSIYQEGFRIPPSRLTDELIDLLCANSRTPEERRGDMRAQLAAHAVGEKRAIACAQKYGVSFLRDVMQELLRYGQALMEGIITQIPDGCFRFEDVLDSDGVDGKNLPVTIALTIKGNRAEADFSGSAPSVAGSVNAVAAITRSAVYYCFLCLVVTPSKLHAFPLHDPPLNQGCFDPILLKLPRGSIVNAEEPAAVAGGNVETSQRMVDVVLGALAQALPDIVPAASQGTMNNITVGGIDPRTGLPFAYYETIAGGMGAGPAGAGLSGVQVHMTNTLNTPVEAFEFAYPMRVQRYALRTGSGGKGKHAGGEGVIRSLEMLTDADATLLTERRTHAPYGLQGGEPGACGENFVWHQGRRKKLPGKINLQLKAGDVIGIHTPGGGGFGIP